MIRFQRMPERPIEPDLVDVVSTLLVADDESCLDQVGHDAVHGPLSDAHET